METPLFSRHRPPSGWSDEEWQAQCQAYDSIEDYLERIEEGDELNTGEAEELADLIMFTSWFPRPSLDTRIDTALALCVTALWITGPKGWQEKYTASRIGRLLMGIREGLDYYVRSALRYPVPGQDLIMLPQTAQALGELDLEEHWMEVLTILNNLDYSSADPRLFEEYNDLVLGAIHGREALAWQLARKVEKAPWGSDRLENCANEVLERMNESSYEDEVLNLIDLWKDTWTGSTADLLTAASDVLEVDKAQEPAAKPRTILARVRARIGSWQNTR